MVSCPSERSGTPSSSRTIASVIAEISSASASPRTPGVLAWASRGLMAVAMLAAGVGSAGPVMAVRMRAGGGGGWWVGRGALVRGDDLPQGLLALAVALGDGMRVESGVDLGLQGVGLGAGAGDVGVGPGDVAAGAVAAVKAGGDRSTLCAAVGVAQRGQRVVVARQQGVWVVEHAQPAVVQQRPSLPLGQHRTLVGGGELSSAGAVAFGRGAADVLTVLQPVGGLGEGVGQGAGAF